MKNNEGIQAGRYIVAHYAGCAFEVFDSIDRRNLESIKQTKYDKTTRHHPHVVRDKQQRNKHSAEIINNDFLGIFFVPNFFGVSG